MTAVVGAPAAAQLPIALDAQVVAIQPPVTEATYSTLDYGNKDGPADDKAATTTWRVVSNTGNCCENYLTTSKAGRLYDFGGRYVNYSDDRWPHVEVGPAARAARERRGRDRDGSRRRCHRRRVGPVLR